MMTPNGWFTLIEVPLPQIPAALQVFQIEADAALEGLSVGGGGAVTSVFGRTGNVVAATNDYTWAQINKATSSLADITTRSAGDLNSGTLPDGRFPATLPAISGVNLTNLNASNLSSGTLPDARFPATLPALSGANLTNLNATNLSTGTVPAARMPALTGDVTTTSGSVATTIADNAVSLAKLADIATASFLGRNTSGTGDPEVLSIATAKTMLGLAGTLTPGSVVFAGVSGALSEDNANLFWDDSNNRLGIGTATPGQKLEVTGNVFINSGTANLFLKDTSTGLQSASTTVITPLNNNALRSTSYTSGLIGWNISALGNAEFNNVDIRGAIHASIITYNAIAATAGTLGVFKSAAKLRSDVTIPASPTYGTTTVDISVVDPDGLAHASSQIFAGNDILRLKDGLTGDTWLKVSAIVDDGTHWRYGCIIMAGTANVTYRAGLGVADYGLSGQGFIIQTADQANAPYLQMATHLANFTSLDASGTLSVTPRLRLGNLNGSYGYASDVYGFGTGQYGTAGQSWVTVDPTNGVRIGSNTTTRIQLAADGSGFVANNNASWTNAGVFTISGWTVNTTSISSGTTYLASGFDQPAGQLTWFGKAASGYQGFSVHDASGRQIDTLVGNGSIYPYTGYFDGTRFRVVIGGLNFAFGSDGSTNSMGMKIWSSAGAKLVEFSDVQNIIAGWAISSTKISSTGIDIHSGASAALAFGATPPTSASAGTGIWLDSTGLFGLLSGTVQVKVDAATGAINAGAGNLTLDSAGVKLSSGISSTNQIKWMDTTNIGGFMYHDLGATHDLTALGSVSYTNNKNARTSILSQGTSGIGGQLDVNSSGATFSSPASKTWITMYQTGGAASDFLGVVIGSNSIPTFSGTGPTLEIHGNGFRVVTSRTPASAAATGNAGEFAWDTGFIYVCVSNSAWKRAALSSW